MAIVRAKIEHLPLILSTATPDLETMVNVEEGKYDCVKLQSRYANASLPDIKIIDLKKDKPQKGEWGVSWLAPSAGFSRKFGAPRAIGFVFKPPRLRAADDLP